MAETGWAEPPELLIEQIEIGHGLGSSKALEHRTVA